MTIDDYLDDPAKLALTPEVRAAFAHRLETDRRGANLLTTDGTDYISDAAHLTGVTRDVAAVFLDRMAESDTADMTTTYQLIEPMPEDLLAALDTAPERTDTPTRGASIWTNVTHLEGNGDPIVLDPQERYGDPFNASRFLREMANDLLGPGVIIRTCDGGKLTDDEFDALDAALDTAEAAYTAKLATRGVVSEYQAAITDQITHITGMLIGAEHDIFDPDLASAIDAAEAFALPTVDGMPAFFDPMPAFGDIDHAPDTTPEEKP